MKNQRLILLFILLAVYLSSIGSDPILGDSLVFTVTASQGFDLATNATNHFLYINTLAILHNLLPYLNPHYLFAGFSSVCAVAALYFIGKWLDLINTKKNTVNFVILIFGFSFTFWRTAAITEVYSFYLMLVSLFLYKLFLFQKKEEKGDALLSAFIFGTLFLVHIQTILLIPFYLYFQYQYFGTDWKKVAVMTAIPASIACLLLAPVLLGNQTFTAIFTDDAWGRSFLILDANQSVKSLLRNSGFLVYNFVGFLFLVITGYRKVAFKRYIWVIGIPYLLFILKHDVSDSYVFHLIPYVFLLPAMAQGIERLKVANYFWLALSLPLFYFIIYKVVLTTNAGNSIEQNTGFKGGVRYLLYPPLRSNPDLQEFIRSYEENKLHNRAAYDRQYNYAKEWNEYVY